MSLAHAVASHVVKPTLTAALRPPAPKLEPSTVTLRDPVEAWLDQPDRLTRSLSVETVAVQLAARRPLVKTADTLRRAASVTSDTTDVSDTHAVCLLVVYPALTPALCPAAPMAPPCIVTLTQPVAATFGLDAELSCLASTDKAELAVPHLNPAVTCILLLALPPCAVWQATDESDCHTVASHALHTPAIAVPLDTPMFEP